MAVSHLKSLQALELAVRTGSLKAAADTLSISAAAAGQRVKALEDYLGVDLLTRSRSGLKPAAALIEALPRLARGFAELEAAARLLDLQRGHEIHLAAPSDFADLWLKPRLERFRRQHPNVLFCINGEGDAAMRLGRVDCEISFGPENGAGDDLFVDFVLPISSPENTRRIGVLGKRDLLESFPLLHLDFYREDPAAPGWPEWTRRHRLRRTAPERGIRFQRIQPAIEAVLANAGLVICGLALVRELIEDGRLSLPFPLTTGVWTEHRYMARFRADTPARPLHGRFREWLLAEAAETAAWLRHEVESPLA